MNVVILATRISGNDGVSLECEHWRDVLERMGHKVTFVAGELDQAGFVIPELHFQYPDVVGLHNKVVYGSKEYKKVEDKIFELAGRIEGKLRKFFNGGRIVDLLIIPNVLSLPMHFPFTVAVSRIIEELSIPTIARHHDFWWERERYYKSSMFPFFRRWFPPRTHNIKHVVINSLAKKMLMRRTRINAEVIWDSYDFNSNQNKQDSFSKKFRKDFGIAESDIVFLQSTRIIPRKRIELSIELIKKLNIPKAILVLAGKAGDESKDYEDKVIKEAKLAKIRFLQISDRVDSHRKVVQGQRIYNLNDCYLNSDFMTYPSKIEGFGNQFIEAVYFRKPIIMTPYPVYEADIKPLGFETIEMPDKVTSQVLKKVKDLINNPDKIKSMVEKNFEIGKRHFSYECLERKLANVIEKICK